MTPRAQYKADLARVTPDMLIAWLERDGWERASSTDSAHYYDTQTGCGWTVMVPVMTEWRDYVRNVKLAIEELAEHTDAFPRDVLDQVLGIPTRSEMLAERDEVAQWRRRALLAESTSGYVAACGRCELTYPANTAVCPGCGQELFATSVRRR